MWQLFPKADGGGNDSDAEAEQLVILSWHARFSSLYIPSKKVKKGKKDDSWHARVSPLYIPSLHVSGSGISISVLGIFFLRIALFARTVLP